MRRSLCCQFLLVGVCCALLGSVLSAQQNSILGPNDYSATMVMHTSNGKTMTMKVAKLGNRYRSVMTMPGRPQTVTHIMQLDTKKMFMIMSNNMCMEMPLRQMPTLEQMQQESNAHSKVIDLGPATITVDGRSYATEHRRMTYTADNGKSYTSDVWTANSLHNFPVQIVSQDGKMRITYHDISLNPPPAALFVPPANCRSMGGMFGHGMMHPHMP